MSAKLQYTKSRNSDILVLTDRICGAILKINIRDRGCVLHK